MTDAQDYFAGAEPTRSILGEGQARLIINGKATISAGSTSSADIYSVPEGYVVVLGSLHVAQSKSCMGEFLLKLDGVTISDDYFDTELRKEMPESAGLVISGGTAIGVTLYNNESESMSISFVLIGTLELA